MSKRKAFNFYYSYYEVYKQLKTKEEKTQFIEAILDKQFFGVEPELKGMVNFAYISQKHSIDSQVEGWENKMQETLKINEPTKSEGGKQGGKEGGSAQGKEQEEVKGKGKGQNVYRAFAHLSITKSECNKLFSLGYSVIQIDNILEAIENSKSNTKYKSLFLTAKNWLKKEPPSRNQIENGKDENGDRVLNKFES